ncbi:MAG: Rieske (2Fe-2S) protein [Alphaproteobacteria bacterium]|nr:Rieske (2Fe-2S) protein [Alphaproteobacteria bacterium]
MKAEDYTQGDAFQAEKRTIFTAEWLPACAEEQLSEPGDFLSGTVGGWGIVAVRDKAGEVRVLRNLCRHQAMPVVGQPTGKCEQFRCRFHGWTYDLAGKLIGAPAPVAPPDPASPAVDMIPFAVVRAGGMVFFSLDGTAPPPQLEGPIPAHGGTLSTDIACNWKVVAEHLLGAVRSSADFIWLWPLLAVRRAGPIVLVEQIVPHTFLRTRLLTHVFGGSADDHHASAEMIKQACETLQADRAGGHMARAEADLLQGFHRRLGEIYAGAAAAT